MGVSPPPWESSVYALQVLLMPTSRSPVVMLCGSCCIDNCTTLENKWDFVLFLPSLSSDDAHVDALRRPTGRVKRRRSRSRGQPTLLADQFEGEGLEPTGKPAEPLNTQGLRGLGTALPGSACPVLVCWCLSGPGLGRSYSQLPFPPGTQGMAGQGR
ncbi:unnamed protein product [Gadus morhua 'NCC']